MVSRPSDFDICPFNIEIAFGVNVEWGSQPYLAVSVRPAYENKPLDKVNGRISFPSSSTYFVFRVHVGRDSHLRYVLGKRKKETPVLSYHLD